MLLLTVNRINETGSKTNIDLNLQHISFVANYFKSNLKSAELKAIQDTTCIVALSNGVVMHIEMSRPELLNWINR